MSQSLSAVAQIAADLFGVSADKVTDSFSAESTDKWDSVAHLNLVTAVEERFDIMFEPEEVDEMKTIGAIAKLVDEKRAG
ncbi:MAG: acyl carrier protein [Myxococcales bacterium]|nr:acyl carrier protein [Myxococcales bacterium]